LRDGGECYETLYALHRFREAGFRPRIAAPSPVMIRMLLAIRTVS
jgi:hypothetical protein